MAFFAELCQTAPRIVAAQKLADAQSHVDSFNRAMISTITIFGDCDLYQAREQFLLRLGDGGRRDGVQAGLVRQE